MAGGAADELENEEAVREHGLHLSTEGTNQYTVYLRSRTVGPFLAAGSITKMDGKAKAAGKTTLALDAVRCVLTGQRFLGYPVEAGSVVYLTEQSPDTFKIALRRAGLLHHTELHVLSYSAVAGVYDWDQIVAGAAEMVRDVSAKLLVIDTVHQFAGQQGDAENQADRGGHPAPRS